ILALLTNIINRANIEKNNLLEVKAQNSDYQWRKSMKRVIPGRANPYESDLQQRESREDKSACACRRQGEGKPFKGSF
uniref:Uncharacterized protein n=1 Tax=Romanomermis culicivorax TaxID=13658 RepID=A0A915JPH4_ROMCU